MNSKEVASDVPKMSSVGMDDIDEMRTLASEIWHRHYADIIGTAQIDYMLAQRYSPDVLRAELMRNDLWWDQLLIAGRMRGFASYFLNAGAAGMKLDKLYIHHEQQRKGYGRLMLTRVETVARRNSSRRLTLAVNKKNHGAIAAYEKYGFRTVDAVVKDIGDGFVMDDYIMVKQIG